MSVIVLCCLGMQFAVREHLFRVLQATPMFDSGESTVPRLLVAMKFCPWCANEIQIVEERL